MSLTARSREQLNLPEPFFLGEQRIVIME